MNLDDPKKPEFATWMSYRRFTQLVCRGSRYVWNEKVHAFLDTVSATLNTRDVKVPKGSILYRAQQGIRYLDATDSDDNIIEGVRPVALKAERMKPLKNIAVEGRANPAGIPVLYLSLSEQTAISEIRPWNGSRGSLAQFRTIREIKIVNLTKGHGHTSFEHFLTWEVGRDISSEEKELAVWTDIDAAFSRPAMLSNDVTEYVPTQILAELFRGLGYDGLIYRSNFGKEGHNIALFDIEDAEFVNAIPYQITGVELKFKQIY